MLHNYHVREKDVRGLFLPALGLFFTLSPLLVLQSTCVTDHYTHRPKVAEIVFMQ